ncbi:MAG: ABC transporter permease subunit [Gammaproteobacteria bacterium]|nr:ABC transporter permease subunit [Gammaproteobacteria bacterium]
MNGFVTALKSEMFIALRTFSSKLIILAPALIVVLQNLLLWVTETGQAARDSLLGNASFDEVVSANAYGYFVDSMSTGLTMLGLLLVAQAAYSFSYERETGMVRHLLIRRVSRPALMLAKLLHLHLLAVASILVLLIAAYLCSGLFWEFGPIVEDGFELISEEEILFEIHTGLQLALMPIPAAIAFGLLISVLSQSATQAVTSALGITLVMDIFKGMLGDYANFLYARFQPSLIDASYLQDVSRIVRGYSDVLVDEEVLQMNLWVPIPALLLFVAVTLVLIQGKKI